MITLITVLSMRKLDPTQQGAATLLALRLPPALLQGLDALITAEQTRLRVPARLSRAEVVRALLEQGLRAAGVLVSLPDSLTPAPKQVVGASARKKKSSRSGRRVL